MRHAAAVLVIALAMSACVAEEPASEPVRPKLLRGWAESVTKESRAIGFFRTESAKSGDSYVISAAFWAGGPDPDAEWSEPGELPSCLRKPGRRVPVQLAVVEVDGDVIDGVGSTYVTHVRCL